MKRSLQPQTVTELTKSIKVVLENGFSFVSVLGEISNLRRPYSGHLYFTLKDSSSQLKAVLFKMQQRYLSAPLEDGMQVICRGRISVYEPRGDYQLIIDTVDFHGSGALQIAYEKLKAKLAAQGLFDQEHKKELPLLPERIAIISSPQGAAIHDFITVAKKRCPSVPMEVYPVRVQGQGAAQEIIEALKLAEQRNRASVVVICRGGGSIEDLWEFNNEELAQAVSACTIPVVSAIGHEIDFTILDFVADRRAATPTAAAEEVLPDSRALGQGILSLVRRMAQAMNTSLASLTERVDFQKRLLAQPANQLQNLRLRLDHGQGNLIRAMERHMVCKRQKLDESCRQLNHLSPLHTLSRRRENLAHTQNRLSAAMERLLVENRMALHRTETILKAVSPQAILERGYSIVHSTTDQALIRSVDQVSKGDSLELRVSDGAITTKVQSVDQAKK